MIQAPRGTRDVLPADSAAWQALEAVVRDVCARYGYREIRTPVFEHTELFLRGVGDTTDVVQKEMYTFTDKGGRSVTLKPEGTAGVARAFLEHGLFNEALPAKMYYLNCPVFRYEAPQSGRLREHHQFGVEAFGAAGPTQDAEVIALAMEVIRRAGVQNLELTLNSIGCPQCRPQYHQALKDFMQPRLADLCKTCQERFGRNPLRVLDCKDQDCQAALAGAPRMLDYLCPECASHFEQVQAALTDIGLPYRVDSGIVRGLDYYTKTVFEVIATLPDGSRLTACGGGRYDGLVETLGGPSAPGIGFGMGMERILMMLPSPPPAPPLYAYVAAMGEEARRAAFQLVQRLRAAGVACDCDHTGRSLKAQFKYAGKLGAPYVAVIGEQELAEGVYTLRNMQDKQETKLDGAALIAALAAGKEKG